MFARETRDDLRLRQKGQRPASLFRDNELCHRQDLKNPPPTPPEHLSRCHLPHCATSRVFLDLGLNCWSVFFSSFFFLFFLCPHSNRLQRHKRLPKCHRSPGCPRAMPPCCPVAPHFCLLAAGCSAAPGHAQGRSRSQSKRICVSAGRTS